MTASIDILGLGCTAIDDVLYVDAYPAADGKAQVRRRGRQCGGLTAMALAAGAGLGCRAAYAGTLGRDELSQFVLQWLRLAGIDTQYVCFREDARPIRSVVVVDEGRQTRAILFDIEGVFGADPFWPREEVIRSARVLLVDHYGIEGMIRAAEVARSAGIPVVADLESGDSPRLPSLLGLVDHLILSRGFACSLSGASDPAAAVRALWAPGRRAAVVTCGADGCWYSSGRAPGQAVHQPAFAVEAADTTGCGDVFHGAYAAALVDGLDVPAAVRFASAAAALKATRRGARAGMPSRAEVEGLLKTY
ncbi:MAG: PfkB family carbohydrate kinase [Thermoguttaceae bacterium]|jgi:ribokinase